ncbi:uncharacterized protein BDR25DRAFT_255090 [Lindgomyces ingoldianus]|uniref:Uncharacterized protein n=1 Tax=Lindgomyces ingoldianus TaxID=673940 RepID=A0ACB6R609_9PLEO|nr:uncharacterized protein BDR25DRAFT_255090 [Lindgomyces ingoldianus]KAF2474723.1 hypothetical protein BDR25DRAFT_255090 [Lindgomyces ingoldianus]
MAECLEPPDAQLEALAQSEIEALELFRRSPHPYHRRQTELQRSQASTESSSNDFSRTALERSNRITSDEDRRKPRKQFSRTPSDSGTEADDEGYGFVKALPAPPVRPRKGLRDLRGSGYDAGTSPLLTPSQVDDEGRKYSTEYFRPRRDGSQNDGPSPTDDDVRAARQKYLKRRRSELIRRTTETALLGLIGMLAVRGCACWTRLLRWHRELLTHVLVMSGVLALYPLRLLRYSKTREPPSNRRLRQQIRIPAAFDPAPILYPTTLPVLISISLLPSFEKPLLPNVLLGLAALPSQLVPCGRSPGAYSSVHWFVSILPLIASQNTEIPSKKSPPIPYMLKLPPPEGLHPETLVSLFALHQALLPPLHYLTTTSLLPTELHLLSIGLINLYLFANSPQAEIQKTLLWLGGVGIFVLCGKVLKWGVALARIPRWRFRHAGQIIKTRQSFLQVLNETLNSRRSQSVGGRLSDSDADEDDPMLQNPLQKTKSLKLSILDSMRNGSILANESETRSAVEPKQLDISEHNDDSDQKALPRRRNTLPCLPSPYHTSRHHSTRRRSKSIAQSFLSLTPAQAAIRKWFYAGYFYLTVSLIILLPIRYMVGKYGLYNHEPFGWAIGYLFGNIQPLRFQVVNWNLASWIPLPPLHDPDHMAQSQHLGLAEHIRRFIVGEANIRLLLCAYCLSIISIGLIVLFSLSSVVEVDTRRKVFHGMMVAMLLPTIYLDPTFVALALSLVLAIFLLLDLIRASQLPPLSRPLANFLTPYVDGRDLRGPVVVSHIFLLIGCAIPLWLSLAGVDRIGQAPWTGWEVKTRDVSMVAGVVCVGMGDAAASLIGRRYGRRKWPWAGGKSLEGSLAFAVAVTLGLLFGKVWLRLGQWDGGDVDGGFRFGGVTEWVGVVGKAAVCAVGASLNEAVLTGGNDNVVVPVVLWLLVRGVGL